LRDYLKLVSHKAKFNKHLLAQYLSFDHFY